MSVFRNIRILPTHGDRSAVITWSLAPDVPDGDVFVAFSLTGLPESFIVQGDKVASEVGIFHDTNLVLNSSLEPGYYRLLLRNVNGDYFSEKIGILADISPMEYGMIRAIIHREFTEMRVANGFPIWHCIPKSSGPLSPNVDPDTGLVNENECADAENPSYGLKYAGGFHPPLLTWMRPGATKMTRKPPEEGFGWMTNSGLTARMMAYPTPMSEHMLVDPATDRRWLVGPEVSPGLLRGIVPVTFDVTLQALSQSDLRYRFPVPVVDMKSYRRLPYWTAAAAPFNYA